MRLRSAAAPPTARRRGWATTPCSRRSTSSARSSRCRSARESSELFDRPSINLGRIKGGDALNKVPDRARWTSTSATCPARTPARSSPRSRAIEDVEVLRTFTPRAGHRPAHATPTCARCARRSARSTRGRGAERRPRRRLGRRLVPRGRASRRSSSARSAPATTAPRSGCRSPRWRATAGARRLRARRCRCAGGRPRAARRARPRRSRRSRRCARERAGRREASAPSPRACASASLIAARAHRRPDRGRVTAALAAAGRRHRRTTLNRRRKDGSISVGQTSSRADDAGRPQTILLLGSDHRVDRRSPATSRALGHDHARPPRPRQRGDDRAVDPARPAGQHPRPRRRTRSTPPTRSAARR